MPSQMIGWALIYLRQEYGVEQARILAWSL
jgi:hypothetical protein